MLNKKHNLLIKALIDEDGVISASALSSKVKMSVRSIRTYVRDINDVCLCISASQKGYVIDRKLASDLLSRALCAPQTSEERAVYIINQLIAGPKDAYDLCEDLFVSMSTLKNDLPKVKRKLKRFDINLINKNDVLSAHGLEVNKRRLLSSILYDESSINFVSLEVIQNNFIDIDIAFIKNTTLDVLNQNHYFVNDYSLTNLVLHIAIATSRIKNHNVAAKASCTQLLSDQELLLSRQICERLADFFNIIYTDMEITELALLLISRTTSINYREISQDNIYNYIDSDVMTLVHKLIDGINISYCIDLSESEFLIRFALHIKNLIIRSKVHRFSKNPLVQHIKTNCPLIYDSAVYLAGIIKTEAAITINDDEIAYIALHIGSALAGQKKLSDRITAVLCCPNYYDMNIKLVESINVHFSEELIVKDIVNTAEGVCNTDLIISTIPCNDLLNNDFIQINMFLNDTDKASLTKKIQDIKHKKRKSQFRADLKQIFSPDLFEINTSLTTQEEVIDHMAKKLEMLGYVDDTFVDKIIEREEMSSTAYGSFAIPHPIKMESFKTGIYIMISKIPITWGKSQVALILMMSFNPEQRLVFNRVFEPITMILTQNEVAVELTKSSTLDTFIEIMVSRLQ